MGKSFRLFTASATVALLVTIAPGLKTGSAIEHALGLVFGARAQMRVEPLDTTQGHEALGLALRHLANTGVFMMATAHPDDENNGLLVMLNRGLGIRTALATATRGNGGQNEIGPELFEPLGVLRTSELEALHRFDGAEQYFTRAVDFGYTIDIPETLAKWGREEIVGDYVRLIRTIRPDVMSAQSPTATGPGQHAHHALAAILAHDAYTLAGDAKNYPEQIQGGLRPWQPKKFYYAAGFGAFGFAEQGAAGGPQPVPARACRVALEIYDPLLGKTYSEIGTEARSMHKCQGQAQLLALPGGGSSSAFQLAETTVGQPKADETSMFQDIDTSINGLARFAGIRPPRELSDGLNAISSAVQNAQKRFDTENDQATVQPLLLGLGAVRVLRGRLRSINMDEAARNEIELRLRQKEREFQQAIVIANGIRIEALADDGVVVPGQPVRVSLIVANRGATDVQLKGVRFDGFDGSGTCTLTAGAGQAGPGGRGRGAQAPPPEAVSALKKDQVASCRPTLTIPADARITEPYWHRKDQEGRYTFDSDVAFGLPQRPTPFYAQVTFGFTGREDVYAGLPVQYRYEGDIFGGEKRSDVLVAPAFSLKVSPSVAVLPKAPAPEPPPAPARGTAPPPTTQGRGRGAAPAPARGAAPAGRGTAPAAGRGATAARGGQTTARGAVPAATPPPPPPPPPSREVRVTVVNDLKGAAQGVVKLEIPAGWTSTPTEQQIAFSREDESQTVRFQITPPPAGAPGDFALKASFTANGAEFRRGFQVVEYPHIRRQHIYEDADVSFKVLDVKTSPNLRVGYIMGTGDEVPEALEQLGVPVTLLNADDLAWGDLSRFGTIVAGIRAYEHRDDLIANNNRLLEYVRNGGTFIVQYNRDPFNAAQYGPYPAVVSSDRVTDENSPVRILVPSDPIFTSPNRITDAAWQNWIQERGTYFLGERDSRYRDLVELADPFPNNPGPKRGALVDATYGRGHWVYVGLGLWRQAAVGVHGAYPLLANLISLGH